MAADDARDRHSEHLCPVDDDRRLLTVAYQSDTLDSVLDTERLGAADGRAERSDGPGQAPLSDGERNRLDYTHPWANEVHARSVKGIAQAEGVEDWVAYYDGTLTVDEHREVMRRAGRQSGKRTDDVDVEENAGGIMADQREPDQETGETEQQTPDAFRVAEGGQETL